MTDEQTPEDKPMEDPEFMAAFRDMMSDLAAAIGKAPRVDPGHYPDDPPPGYTGRIFDEDMNWSDVDNPTEEEALYYMGSHFDESTNKAMNLLRQMGCPDEHLEHLSAHAHHYLRDAGIDFSTIKIRDMRPSVYAVDLATLGIYAHEVLRKANIGGIIRMGPGGMDGDILNGKGPFG